MKKLDPISQIKKILKGKTLHPFSFTPKDSPWADIFPPPDKLQMVFDFLEQRYEKDQDPWGLRLNKCRQYLEWFWPLYSTYFRVRVFGTQHVQDRQYMVVSNHTGQLPFDGMLIAMAFLMEIWPPRILRAMVERFLASLPFLGQISSETGFVLGDRQNCQYLMQKGESILVFPEGVRGIAKSTTQFYQLQPFTKGFFRMAIAAKVDILPVAVVGAEEIYPLVYQARNLARRFGLPAFPVTPFFPLFGFLGLLPLPSPIDIHIGPAFPIPTDLSPDAPDRILDQYIAQIENQIKEMTEKGRSEKRSMLTLPWETEDPLLIGRPKPKEEPKAKAKTRTMPKSKSKSKSNSKPYP